MQKNNNYSPLPWYDSIDEQNHRMSYAYGNVYPLYTPAKTLLPFQIVREHSNATIQHVELYKKDGTLYADITERMLETGLTIVPFAAYGYDVIVYRGVMPILDMQYDGQYYCMMGDGINTWYSEVFTVVQDMQPYLKIEWYSKEDVVYDGGRIVYDGMSYHNFLFFDTQVGKPEYKFTEEGEERDGFFFPEKQLSEKVYKCNILAPEYLCDCMRLIRMADYVRVVDRYGRIYYCDSFLITPEWQTQGDLASVEIEFETDTVVKKIGCGYLQSRNGDYNDDYNNDYNNE